LTASEIEAKGARLSKDQEGEVSSTRQDHVQIVATLLAVDASLYEWSKYRIQRCDRVLNALSSTRVSILFAVPLLQQSTSDNLPPTVQD
jgi:hypothetical protein